MTGIDGSSLTSAGQVSDEDRTITLRDGTTPSGNFTAVKIDLTDIVPGGDYGSGDIAIDTLDYAGRTIKSYEFTIPRRGTPAWYDTDTSTAIEPGEVTFEPGEGFSVTGVDGSAITIPGPAI